MTVKKDLLFEACQRLFSYNLLKVNDDLAGCIDLYILQRMQQQEFKKK